MEAVFLLGVGYTADTVTAITCLTLAVGFSGFAISGAHTLPYSLLTVKLLSHCDASKVPLPVGIRVRWVHPSLHPKRQLDRFICFCSVHDRDQHRSPTTLLSLLRVACDATNAIEHVPVTPVVVLGTGVCRFQRESPGHCTTLRQHPDGHVKRRRDTGRHVLPDRH